MAFSVPTSDEIFTVPSSEGDATAGLEWRVREAESEDLTHTAVEASTADCNRAYAQHTLGVVRPSELQWVLGSNYTSQPPLTARGSLLAECVHLNLLLYPHRQAV